MRRGPLPLTIVVLAAITACGPTPDVHTTAPIRSAACQRHRTARPTPPRAHRAASTGDRATTRAPKIRPGMRNPRRAARLRPPDRWQHRSGPGQGAGHFRSARRGVVESWGSWGFGFRPRRIQRHAGSRRRSASSRSISSASIRAASNALTASAASATTSRTNTSTSTTRRTHPRTGAVRRGDGFVDGCKEKYGDSLRFYSTENTARDMDAIRAALGDDQLSYLGHLVRHVPRRRRTRRCSPTQSGDGARLVVETNGDTTEQAVRDAAGRFRRRLRQLDRRGAKQ